MFPSYAGMMYSEPVTVYPTPINEDLPEITGTAQVGATLTCSTGTWSEDIETYSYQWKSGITSVGTNQNTYVAQTGDLGNTITCTVVATTEFAKSGTATSDPTSAVIAGSVKLPVHSTLVWVGDSNTDRGYSPSGYAFRAPIYAGSQLNVSWSPQANRGFAGSGIVTGVNDIPNVIAQNPDLVIIMYGTNDGNRDSTWQNNYKTCLQAYKNAGAKVIAVGIPPRYLDYAPLAINSWIAAQPEVDYYCDPLKYMVPGDSPDVHFNDDGHEHLAMVVTEGIQALVDNTDPFDDDDSSMGFDFSGSGGTFGSVSNVTITGTKPTGWRFGAFNGGGTPGTLEISTTTQLGKPAMTLRLENCTAQINAPVSSIPMLAGETWGGGFKASFAENALWQFSVYVANGYTGSTQIRPPGLFVARGPLPWRVYTQGPLTSGGNASAYIQLQALTGQPCTVTFSDFHAWKIP